MLNVLAVDSSTYFNVEPSTSSTFKTFIVTIILLPSTSSNADRFQNSVTGRLNRKYEIKPSLKISSRAAI